MEADHYESAGNNHVSSTGIRAAFKYYKTNIPKPDYSNVLDLTVTDESKGINVVPVSISEELAKDFEGEHLRLATIKSRPGFYLLQGFFSKEEQLKWMVNCLHSYPENGSKNNVNCNSHEKLTDVFKTHGKKLRWVTKGYDYDWTSKVYPDRMTSQFPEEFQKIGKLVCGLLKLGDFCGDTAIINYYPEKSTLSPHTDHSERNLGKPLVSLSFGQSAVFLLGGVEEECATEAILLNSSDIMVMSKECRLCYHAVPKILKTTKFDANPNVPTDVLEYANNNRINITIRQCD
uniref:Fe2OG dioxygenase domain-containing protein n=1 Tax=Rhabditophanes sp. KR3021 TaxID=114890 RepID=A0AC35UHK5_9BILA